MTNEDEELTLDQLMDLDPLELTDQHIEKVIDYQRKHRNEFETTGKAPKKDAGPKMQGSLIDVLGLKPTTGPIPRRKV